MLLPAASAPALARAFAASGLVTVERRSPSATPPFWLALDFMNFTYAKNSGRRRNVPVPVVMRKGTFSDFDKGMGTRVSTSTSPPAKEGSLRSGTRVKPSSCWRAISRSAERRRRICSTSAQDGAGTARAGRRGQLRRRLGTRAGLQSHVRFAKGFLYVETHAGTISCTMNLVTTYVLRAGKLTKVFVQTRKPRLDG